MNRNILFILGKDAHNKGPYKIYKECIRREFHVDVYATETVDNHTMLFSRDNIKIKHIQELNEACLEQYDYIFSAVPLFNKDLFLNVRKYVFLNPSTHLDEVFFSGDFIFTTRDISLPLIDGEYWPIERLNYAKSLPAMATGGAFLEKRDSGEKTRTNVILFVDAGHFPFGTKKELAEYIIEIARYCTDYEVRVKPRYLPGDQNPTHKTKENIYDYLQNIDNLPQNLTLILKHTDLSEEVENADLVICPEGTTSYEEAILLGKKLIIFTGFPSKESILWSKNRIEFFNKIPKNLCNRVYYKDIFQYLPNGIPTKIEDLNHSLYKTSDIAKGIVDAMEYIYTNFISKNIFPQQKYYKVDNYVGYMIEDEKIDWSQIISRRYKSILYDCAAQRIGDLCINIDCSKVFDFIESDNRQLNAERIQNELDNLNDLLCELYIDNANDLQSNTYSQSLLCLAYYKKNRFSEFHPPILKCIAYYNYCLAKIKFESGKYKEALNHINNYFDEVNHNLYEVSFADNYGVKVMAHYYKGAILFNLNKLDEAKVHLDICDKEWEGKHKKAKEYLCLIEEETEIK